MGYVEYRPLLGHRVGLEDKDEDTDDYNLDQLGGVASSSSSDLRNPPAVPSASSQLVSAYDVDEAVLQAMERGKIHDWIDVEFKAICRKHGLSVRGAKSELMERVKVHFQRLCRLQRFFYEPCHRAMEYSGGQTPCHCIS